MLHAIRAFLTLSIPQRWLSTISGGQDFSFSGVKLQNGNTLTYKEWNDKLQASFEKHFFVPALGKVGVRD